MQRAHAPAQRFKTMNVLTAAAHRLRETQACFLARRNATVRNAITHWFAAQYPYDDRPRWDYELGLSEEQWQWLRIALGTVTYKDELGQERHHESLQHFKETREKVVRERKQPQSKQQEARKQLQQLENIQAVVRKSTSNRLTTLDGLTEKVVERFDDKLESRLESFKEMRVRVEARVGAQRFLGQRPLMEAYWSKKKLKVKVGSNEEPQLISTHTLAWKEPHTNKTHDLMWEEGAWHLTGCLDGCSVYVTAAPEEMGRHVWCEVRIGAGL